MGAGMKGEMPTRPCAALTSRARRTSGHRNRSRHGSGSRSAAAGTRVVSAAHLVRRSPRPGHKRRLFVRADRGRGRLVAYRVIGAFLLLSLGWAAKRAPRSASPDAYLIATVVFAAAAIELVVLASGGHQSPFYVGMIFLGLASAGFVPVRLAVHVLIFGLILALYVIPTALFDGAISNPQEVRAPPPHASCPAS